LGALIDATKKQVHTESASLAVVREALELIATPVLGVDDQWVIMFANAAAEQAFASVGGLLGSALQDLRSELPVWLALQPQGERTAVEMAGRRWSVRWNTMGKNSSSRGMLLSLLPLPSDTEVPST